MSLKCTSNVENTYSYEVLTVKCLLHAPIEVNIKCFENKD